MLHARINAFICNEYVDTLISIKNDEPKQKGLDKVIKDLRTALDESVNK